MRIGKHEAPNEDRKMNMNYFTIEHFICIYLKFSLDASNTYTFKNYILLVYHLRVLSFHDRNQSISNQCQESLELK